MLRNVTFTADGTLIERARARAKRRNSTLNEEFREWLARFAAQEEQGSTYRKLMEHLAYASAGQKFTREDLNER